MIGLLSAWHDNRRTFGGGESPWGKTPVWRFYLGLMLSSLSLAVASKTLSADALNAILTAISIIAGFTFSTLIFLVDHKFDVRVEKDSLEQESLQKKLDRLADSSFSILYYFNVIAAFLVFGCILGLLMPSLSARSPVWLSQFFWVTEVAGRFVLFGLLLEAFITFARALRRLKYLFVKVRQRRV